MQPKDAEVADIQVIKCMCSANAECECGSRIPYRGCDGDESMRHCPACGRPHTLDELETLPRWQGGSRG